MSIHVSNEIYRISKEVNRILQGNNYRHPIAKAKLIDTGLEGENKYFIVREIKGVIGVLLGKGVSPLEAWSYTKYLLDEHGPEWYFKK